MKKTLIILLITTSFINATSFSKSKKILLKKIYFDNQNTFYCNNPYKQQKVNKRFKTLIVKDDSFYTPRKKYYKSGKINTRAKRVEWEHVMPAYNFGRQLKCWQNGGRKACKKDKLFKKMEADMHNLVPAIGEVNANRSNYRYAAGSPKVGQYGKCMVQIDFKGKKAYVSDDIKGDIARIYFYMSERYNIKLSKRDVKMFKTWNKQDPISKWEKIKNKRVYQLQGNKNRFIN